MFYQLLVFLRFYNRLSRCETRNRDTERRAGDIIEPDSVEEFDGRRFAAVFAANTELQVRLDGTAFLDSHFHKHTDALLVDPSERIGFEDAFVIVVAEEFAGIVRLIRRSSASGRWCRS